MHEACVAKEYEYCTYEVQQTAIVQQSGMTGTVYVYAVNAFSIIDALIM